MAYDFDDRNTINIEKAGNSNEIPFLAKNQ